jgi:hypothetical protein
MPAKCRSVSLVLGSLTGHYPTLLGPAFSIQPTKLWPHHTFWFNWGITSCYKALISSSYPLWFSTNIINLHHSNSWIINTLQEILMSITTVHVLDIRSNQELKRHANWPLRYAKTRQGSWLLVTQTPNWRYLLLWNDLKIEVNSLTVPLPCDVSGQWQSFSFPPFPSGKLQTLILQGSQKPSRAW